MKPQPKLTIGALADLGRCTREQVKEAIRTGELPHPRTLLWGADDVQVVKWIRKQKRAELR